MADSLCRNCGKARTDHSLAGVCLAPGGKLLSTSFSPPPDEPKRCTCLPGDSVFMRKQEPDCPTHGPNRPEPQCIHERLPYIGGHCLDKACPKHGSIEAAPDVPRQHPAVAMANAAIRRENEMKERNRPESAACPECGYHDGMDRKTFPAEQGKRCLLCKRFYRVEPAKEAGQELARRMKRMTAKRFAQIKDRRPYAEECIIRADDRELCEEHELLVAELAELRGREGTLRELLAALPRCNIAHGCQRIGLYEWHGEDLACDEHCPSKRANGYDLPYAAVIRRMGP